MRSRKGQKTSNGLRRKQDDKCKKGVDLSGV